MKKVLFLIVSIVILGCVFTGCSEITKISSPATVNTDSDLYKCECFGPETATGYGTKILPKGTWFMYNEYPGDGDPKAYWDGSVWNYHINAGNPKKHGLNRIGAFWVMDLGGHWYSVRYGIDSAFVVLEEHLAIQDDPADFTAKPGQDDNQDFVDGSLFNDEEVKFYDENGHFYIFAHFAMDCAPE